jgi:hypothetical protein
VIPQRRRLDFAAGAQEYPRSQQGELIMNKFVKVAAGSWLFLMSANPATAQTIQRDFCTGQALDQCLDQYGTSTFADCANQAYASCVDDNPQMYPNGNPQTFTPEYWNYQYCEFSGTDPHC